MSTNQPSETLSNFSLKEEIRAYWSDRAATFDQSISHAICDRFGMPEWHRLIRQACDLTVTDTLEQYTALDIACGTGEVSRVLTNLGATVTGIDFSEPMLDIARTKLQGEHWTGLLADAESLQLLADDSFDLAITRHLAWTLTDPDAAYHQWRRVLRPGGRLIVVDGNWAAQTTRMDKFKRWLADRLDGNSRSDRGGGDRTRHEQIRAQLPYSTGLDRPTLQTGLEGAGFTTFRSLSVASLYGKGMRAAPLAQRLRQTAAHRFAIVAW